MIIRKQYHVRKRCYLDDVISAVFFLVAFGANSCSYAMPPSAREKKKNLINFKKNKNVVIPIFVE